MKSWPLERTGVRESGDGFVLKYMRAYLMRSLLLFTSRPRSVLLRLLKRMMGRPFVSRTVNLSVRCTREEGSIISWTERASTSMACSSSSLIMSSSIENLNISWEEGR
jgi:hypothetical protein